MTAKPMTSESGHPRGLLRSPIWAQRSFLKLWAGQSVSLVGSAVTSLALPLTAIYTLHTSAAQLGLLKTVQWLPYILFSLHLGAWTDRRRRKSLMIGANLGQAIVLCAIVALALTHVLTLPVLIVAVFITGGLTVAFDLSYNAYLPSLVDRDLLIQANSRLQTSASVAVIGGPGLGGLLVQLLTAPVALLADAASYLFSVVSLLWIRQPEPVPAAKPEGPGVTAQIKTGLKVVLGDPLLRALVGTSAFFNLFAQWISVLIILFAVHVLRLPAGAIGLMVGTPAVGAIAGSLIANRVSKRFGIGPTVMACVVFECAVLLAIPFAPASHPAWAAVMIAVVLAASGLGSALSSIVGISVRQSVTPPELYGRMTATYRFVSFGVIALGSLFGGLAGQAFGLRPALLYGAIGLQSTIIWMALSKLPRVRELPPPPSAQSDAGPAPKASEEGPAECTEEDSAPAAAIAATVLDGGAQ
jgi:MFS family permease